MRLRVTTKKQAPKRRVQQTPRSRKFLFWRAAARGGNMRLAERRRREHILATVLVLIISVFSFGFFSIISHYPQFAIRGIHISGDRALSKTALEAAATAALYGGQTHIFSRTNILLYPRDDIASALRTVFPRIKAVDISIENREIHVAVAEREPSALWCRDIQERDCFFLDDEGVIFASADGIVAENTHTFSGGVVSGDPRGTKLLPTYFGRVSGLVRTLEESGLSITQVHVLNDRDFEVRTRGGMAIRAGFTQEESTIVQNTQAALASKVLKGRKEELKYIDVRFGDKVYFKFEGEE